MLLVWAVMGGMALCGALCYGALAARYPQAGGGYVYLREAYGPRVAFLYGWKCLLDHGPGHHGGAGDRLCAATRRTSCRSATPDRGSWRSPRSSVFALVHIAGVRLGVAAAHDAVAC